MEWQTAANQGSTDEWQKVEEKTLLFLSLSVIEISVVRITINIALAKKGSVLVALR